MHHNGVEFRGGRAAAYIAVSLFFFSAGCAKRLADVPHVVTADIQAGIEKHIEDTAREGGGYFRLPYEDRELSLKLVRVHTEYLANLGPRRHFACVDLADTRGDVYDVDFFLSGDPGDMTVTRTIAHKLNGKPFYMWEQKPDKTWQRVPAEGAARHLMGIRNEDDEFEFRYVAKLPEISESGRMWLPYPVSDSFQKVTVKSMDIPGKHRMLQETEHGNTIIFSELTSLDSGKTVDIRYQVQRKEKAAYAEPGVDLGKHLEADRLVPLTEDFRAIAEKVTENKKGDLRRARALYDHVIEQVRYIKNGVGWGQGDAVFACDARHGNCTDFHALFIALARAVGIPARFAIGAAIPSSRHDGGVNGYHCWVEFHAEGKWWPVDISEADKYSSESSYYFGHHPANRVEFSRGRDLVVEPGPAAGPINFLAYPVLEIDGNPVKVKTQFSFTRSDSAR